MIGEKHYLAKFIWNRGGFVKELDVVCFAHLVEKNYSLLSSCYSKANMSFVLKMHIEQIVPEEIGAGHGQSHQNNI